MGHKITIAIDARTDEQRDAFLRKLRDVLLSSPGLEGKITTKRTIDVFGGHADGVDLTALGLDEARETPLERAIGRLDGYGRS